ncbi:MAG: undecaprenyl-diphosphate phosphatase [Planctomycetes bacterium]|nr:undecaprenyl-diphosphate phosphatase [Planctomycetota bacterium]MBI3835595.1 undecaprenyl-diphosphate phosphatase [Planctomycetota bacterium]
MTILHSLILGIIEGLTEFLPVSSTGHLILVSQLFQPTHTDFLKSFEIIIQLGAIASVVSLYWRMFLNWESLKKIIVAFIPTGIVGLFLYKIVKTYLIGNVTIVLWSLFLGGIFLIVFEKWRRLKATNRAVSPTNIKSITYRQAVIIGLCQSVAIIPGVSRSAATIVGGLALGLERRVIVEFSFLLAVPTMLAATGLDLVKNAGVFSNAQFGLLATGFMTAFIVAILAIKYFLRFVQNHTFIPFGIYRILVALLFSI